MQFEANPTAPDYRTGASLLQLQQQMRAIPSTVLDSFTKEMVTQFLRIEKKVKKLSIHWEEACIIGSLAEIETRFFEQVMNDVLCLYLVHKASSSGIQALANLMDL